MCAGLHVWNKNIKWEVVFPWLVTIEETALNQLVYMLEPIAASQTVGREKPWMSLDYGGNPQPA